jgi:hypothetical protein
MTNAQVEAWVLAIADAVAEGRRVEDARVELKAEWPEPRKAARRLAGHANAARGDPILWVVGLDERSGKFGNPLVSDMAAWYPQVAAEFDSSLCPALHDLLVPTPYGDLVGLVFDTSRAPYVVRNPAYGQRKGDPIAWEVPWREGTSVRTATRGDLLRLLVPVLRSPIIEILTWSVTLHDAPGREDAYGEHLHPSQFRRHLQWEVNLELYVTPRTGDLLVLPVHRTQIVISGSDLRCEIQEKIYTVPHVHWGSGLKPDSHTITRTHSEAIISAPGVLRVRGTLYEDWWEYPLPEQVECEFSVAPAGDFETVQVSCGLRRAEPSHRQPTHVATWEFSEQAREGDH